MTSSDIESISFRVLRLAAWSALILPSLLLLVASPRSAEAVPIVTPETPSDTIRATAPRLFERRVLFTPEYLTRLLHSAQPPLRPDLKVVIDPPDERGRAAAYARQYGIDEALALQIVESAVAEGIDPELGFRLVRVESVFRTSARGPAGALGLTQLMPSTARAIDRSLRTESQILDPVTNLRTGFRYLRQMIERYDGDVRLGLLAYNRGPVAVDRPLRQGRDPENGYSSRVLSVVGTPYTGQGLIDHRR